MKPHCTENKIGKGKLLLLFPKNGDLSPGVKREHGTITRIKDAITSHGNPFAVESNAIYNLITHAYIPDEYVPKILMSDDTGQKLHKDCVRMVMSVSGLP